MIAPYLAIDPYYPLDYGYNYGDFMNSYTAAFGAHVKWGLYPYLEARRSSMLAQIEPGTMLPVIKYIRHQREAGQPVTVRAFVEAHAMPVTVTLLYSADGGGILQETMTGDGSGTYTVTLTGFADEAAVSYRLMAVDGAGQSSILPCEPQYVSPVAGDTPLLYINEFMADNEATVTDEYGNYCDWIEIYNGDDEGVFLGDLYLTDNFNIPDKWQLPDFILPAGGFMVFWADGTPTLGLRHTSFKLDKEGEEIGLYTAGLLVIDSLSYGRQREDVSTGRMSDGAEEIIALAAATPGRSNTLTAGGEVIANRKLTAWPNPVTGDHIRLSESVDCRIYSAGGQLVFAGRQVSEIDVSRWRPGLYIILTTDGRVLKFMRVSDN